MIILCENNATVLAADGVPAIGPCVATIGFFDGVHLGHQHLLRQVKAEAARRGVRSLALTFARHPMEVVRPGSQPPLLTTEAEKLGFIGDFGVDACTVLDFTAATARLTSDEFMAQCLQRRLGAVGLVVGYDHHFGADRQNGFAHYAAVGVRMGMDVVQATELDAARHISSSAIRRQLQAGRVEDAAAGLGRPYELSGTVGTGHHEGRKMGYPTANIAPDDARKLLPARGAYAVTAELDGQTYAGMLNIGRRPTMQNGDDTSIEVHLLNFSADIYGAHLTVRFHHRLRGEQRFPSAEALRRQLQRDEEAVRTLLL